MRNVVRVVLLALRRGSTVQQGRSMRRGEAYSLRCSPYDSALGQEATAGRPGKYAYDNNTRHS